MKEIFLKQFANILPDFRERKFLLAVSGGVDSMVLLYLFQKLKLNFEVLHCNFQLREQDSEQDQLLVESICQNSGVKFEIKRFETNQMLENSTGESLQMLARRIRYEWFESQLIDKKADFIVTAHHLSDQIETVLFNLIRGTGISGLRGMLPLQGKVLRPLLRFTKEEIYSFAKQEKLQWREDKSNESDKYKRNFIRNQIVPLLKTLNSNFDQTFLTNIEKFVGYESIIKQFCSEIEINKIDNSIFISDKEIINQKNVVFWFESLKKYDFSYDQIKSLVEISIQDGQSGKKIISSSGFLLLKVHEGWEFSQQEDQLEVDVEFSSLQDDKIHAILNLEMIPTSAVDFGLGNSVGFLDLQKLVFPLRIRNWREGDRFKPYGLKGSKKVSDYLINLKLSITEKNKVLVLEDVEGEIIWVVGFRLAQKCSLTDQTTQVLKLSLK